MCLGDQSLVTQSLVSFFWEELHNNNCIRIWLKKQFFEGYAWFKFNNLGLTQGIAWKLFTIVTKGLKLKVTKFLGLVFNFVEIAGKKLVGGPFTPPIWNRVKSCFDNFGP